MCSCECLSALLERRNYSVVPGLSTRESTTTATTTVSATLSTVSTMSAMPAMPTLRTQAVTSNVPDLATTVALGTSVFVIIVEGTIAF